jgi:hypothetical protein
MKKNLRLRKLGLLLTLLSAVPGLVKASSPPVTMKILLLASSPDDLGYLSMSYYLSHLGTPYQAVFINNLTPDASGNRLSGVPLIDTATGNGLYQGIIQTDSSFSVCSTTCQSLLSNSDWAKLTNYETQYSVRAATYYTYPDPQWGLQAVDSGSGYTEANPLNVTLSAAGASVFSYLNPAAQIPVSGKGTSMIWAYKALPTAAANETTTPLLMAGAYTVAVAHTTADGRETMALTMDNYPGDLHSAVLSYGVINWVTKGVFLGSRRIYLNTQIDDFLLGNRLYAPTLPQCPNDPSCPTVFATAEDMQSLSAWQDARHADPQFESFHATYAYNGVGTTWFPPSDPVFGAITVLKDNFHWISHTWDHSNLDCFSQTTDGVCIPASLSDSLAELNQNINVAPSLGITLDRSSMVTPYNGGLNNPNFMQAAAQVSLQYIVTADDPPGVNLGMVSQLVPSIFLIPRRGNDLFDDVSSPQTGVYGSWPDEYNAKYGPNGTTPMYAQNQTYQQIVETESQIIFLENMMTYEPYPLGYHIDNASVYDGTHSMFTDVMDSAIAKYKSMFSLPVVTIDMSEIGQILMGRASYNDSGVTGVYTPGVGVTLTTQRAATIPVTGACSLSTCINYAGQLQDNVVMPANSSVNLSLMPGAAATLDTLSINPSSIGSGSSSTGTVTLTSAAPNSGVVVNLISNSSAATVPQSVLVPAGTTTASFSIIANSVSVATAATITAQYNAASKSGMITVTPVVTAAVSSISMNPTTVTGGQTASGTVTLNIPAPNDGVTISLSSSTASAVVPTMVTVAAGTTTASFTVSTSAVTTSAAAVITASLNGGSRTASLTITPQVALALSSLTVSPTSVKGGTAVAGTVTLTTAAPTGGTKVSLRTNQALVTTVPASVTVPAGATTTNFSITTKSFLTTWNVTITATYNGINKTAPLTVTR